MNNPSNVLTGLAVFALLPVLASCMSQSPYPISYSFATQKRMQAAEHWKAYAWDVGQTLDMKIKKDRPIFIDRSGKEPVHPMLANFLEEQLLNRGFRLAPTKSADALRLIVSTKVLEHADKRINSTVGVVPAVVGGVLVTLAGSSSVEDTDARKPVIDEVVVTTKVFDGNEVRLSMNNAFYIDPAETWQYDSAPYVAHAGVPAKKMSLTGE